MAQGTGLPLPKPGNDLAQAPTINADALSSAGAWSKIAAAGEQIKNTGLDLLQRDVHLQQAGAIADFENEWRTKNTEARDQFAKDPAGFKNWADASVQGAVAKVPPFMAQHAKDYLTRTFNGSYSSILGETRAQNDAIAGNAIKARRATADEDVMALAAAGKVGTPEWQAAVSVHNDVLKSAVDAGTMAPEMADYLRNDLAGRAEGEVAARTASQVYREKGFDAAVEYLTKNVRENDTLSMKQSQRDKAFNRGLSQIRLLQARDKEDRGAAVEVSKDLRARLDSNQDIDPAEVRSVADELARTGAFTERRNLIIRAGIHDATAAYRPGGGKTLPQLGSDIARMRHEAAPGLQSAIEGAAFRRGVDPGYLTRVALRESGGNLNARNPNSTASGPFQFTDQTWLATFKENAASLGLGDLATQIVGDGSSSRLTVPDAQARAQIMALRNDPNVSSDMAAALTAGNAQALKNGLGRDPNAGELYAAHFLGPGGALAMIKADPSAKAADINPGAAAANTAIFYAKDGRPKTVGEVMNNLTRGQSGGVATPPTFAPVDLPPKEANLIEYHRNNLRNGTYLDQNGDISTVYITGIEGPGGRSYNVPGYWDGKLHTDPKEIQQHAAALGWDNWPSYATPKEADAAAKRVHSIIEADTAKFRRQRDMQRGGNELGDITKGVQQFYVGQEKKVWPAMKKMLENGQITDPTEFEAVRYAAQISGDPSWSREVETFATAQGYGRLLRAAPEGQGQAILDRARQRMEADGGTVSDRQVLDLLQKQYDRQVRMAREDPIGLALETDPSLKAPAPLDFSSSDAARAGLKQRIDLTRRAAAAKDTPLGSPLRPADRAATAAAISVGPVAAAGAAFDMLASAPDEALMPTLQAKEIKDAVAGAVRSTDPARYNAAMSFMDRMWQRAPESVDNLFGTDAAHELAAWQTKRRYLSPDDLAKERSKSALDPQVRERQRAAFEEGLTIARKVKPADVVAKFDTSWWVTPGIVARNLTGSQPIGPGDPVARAALMGDWQQNVARVYAETLDKEQAITKGTEITKTKWAASPINGGKLMLNAPEKYYPSVGGSWDWMKSQLEADLAKTLGPRTQGAAGGGIDISPFGSGKPAYDWELVPDRQTEAEAQAGKPPSYQVVITDNRRNGARSVLPQRYQWQTDAGPGNPVDAFQQQRARVLENEAIRGQIVPMVGGGF